jgi:predicted phage baseplate assembly protein
MPLPVPKLDDRKFQDIVDEAKKRIPHYSKDWTDHNLSDPGITLIELFAWMTDLLLYRLNQVPDLHFITFMEMMGIRLQETVAAKARVTFWLSAPQEQPVLIFSGTEVASQQTEKELSVIFSTDDDFVIQPAHLAAVFSNATGEQNLKRLESGFDGFSTFSLKPKPGDALYFGFENDLSWHILGFELDFDPAAGAGVNPDLPPYSWEASTGQGDSWEACEVEFDTTRGMNSAGKIRIFLPHMGKKKEGGSDLYWVRARVKEITLPESKEGMRAFQVSPKLRKAEAKTWGGSALATHAQLVSKEVVGRSEGSPGERFKLQLTPILKRLPGETLSVLVDGEAPQTWIERPDFAESGARDRHFTLDSVTGELRLGPAVRQPDGTVKLYGAIPPRGATLVFERYRHGGGEIGNVDASIINTLKSTIPFVDRVANRTPARGGLDQESLEAAMLRVPAVLRSRERAVTEADFEYLAMQALPNRIGRVKCVHPRTSEAEKVVPALVYVLIVPYISHPEGRLEEASLRLQNDDVVALTNYLDERRLLTVRVNIRPPAYVWVSVRVTVGITPDTTEAKVEEAILSRLYRFLNPLTGGLEGTGWSFGRHLFLSDVYQYLQGVPGVQYTRNVEMFRTQPGSGPQDKPQEVIELLAHGVIASGIHQVNFVRG